MTTDDNTLKYNGPLKVFCNNCLEEFKEISNVYSSMSKDIYSMKGLGMDHSSNKNSFCNIYQISKIKFKPVDTEIAYLNFIEKKKIYINVSISSPNYHRVLCVFIN